MTVPSAPSPNLTQAASFAGSVAHEMNNLLTVIKAYAQLVLMDTPPDDFRHADLLEIDRGVARAADFAVRLFTFSRTQRLASVRIDVGEFIRDIAAMAASSLRANVSVDIVAPAGVFMKADPEYLRISLLELLHNACDAMPGGGRIQLEVATAPSSAGESVAVLVSDTGVGMDETTRQRMFEPFFTTKERGTSLGLGMPTVGEFVRASGGRIDVRSTPGNGCMVRMVFPSAGASRSELAA